MELSAPFMLEISDRDTYWYNSILGFTARARAHRRNYSVLWNYTIVRPSKRSVSCNWFPFDWYGNRSPAARPLLNLVIKRHQPHLWAEASPRILLARRYSSSSTELRAAPSAEPPRLDRLEERQSTSRCVRAFSCKRSVSFSLARTALASYRILVF